LTNPQDFKDIHKDKLGFILACGVSLHDVNVELLKPYITMNITEAVFKNPEADYFFSCDDDSLAMKFVYRALECEKTKAFLVSGGLPEYTGRAFQMPRKWGVDRTEWHRPYKDDTELIIGVTSVQPAIHLMYIMGCNPIVLLGIDGYYTNGVYGFWMLPEYDNIVTPELKENYAQYGSTLAEAYINKHTKTHFSGNTDGTLSAADGCFKIMNETLKDVTIINANPKSAVNYFTKMPLEEVLEKYVGKDCE
jgi:hypothetical protein